MKKGFTVVEAILSIGVFGILVATIFPTVSWMVARMARSKYDSQAGVVLQETVEATYNVFLGNWEAVPAGDGERYFPAVEIDEAGSRWTLLPGEETVDTKFVRSLQVMAVCRNEDSGGREECDGSNADAASKEIVAQVSWSEGEEEREQTAKLLLVNWENGEI